jgi:hypothetical protein
MLFADRLRFDSFTRWILDLAAQYPALRFEIGIHIHLQWIDSYWWQYHSWLIPRLGEFSRLVSLGAFLSFRSTIVYGNLGLLAVVLPLSACVRSTVSREFYPMRRRRAIVAHQAYLLHRVAVECGATFVVEWGNFPTTWFAAAIDPDYRSTFALFDWNGNPQLMYWAIVRGLTNDKR